MLSELIALPKRGEVTIMWKPKDEALLQAFKNVRRIRRAANLMLRAIEDLERVDQTHLDPLDLHEYSLQKEEIVAIIHAGADAYFDAIEGMERQEDIFEHPTKH